MHLYIKQFPSTGVSFEIIRKTILEIIQVAHIYIQNYVQQMQQ